MDGGTSPVVLGFGVAHCAVLAYFFAEAVFEASAPYGADVLVAALLLLLATHASFGASDMVDN